MCESCVSCESVCSGRRPRALVSVRSACLDSCGRGAVCRRRRRESASGRRSSRAGRRRDLGVQPARDDRPAEPAEPRMGMADIGIPKRHGPRRRNTTPATGNGRDPLRVRRCFRVSCRVPERKSEISNYRTVGPFVIVWSSAKSQHPYSLDITFVSRPSRTRPHNAPTPLGKALNTQVKRSDIRH